MLIQTGPFAGLAERKYKAILVDPPWKYKTWSVKGAGRSPDRHYKTMTLDEIKALPVRQLAARDCVLFMWVIDSHTEMAFEVLKAWGFKFKTVGFYWAKTNKDGSFFTGTGHWTRANPEHMFEAYLAEEQTVERVFLATVGQPPRHGKNVQRLMVSARREHSRKPDDTRERIEQLVGGPYLELFGRESRPGWSVWGDEATLFDAPQLAQQGMEYV